jgi:iron-sulfur cluster repair protein YtfE (RIC family)
MAENKPIKRSKELILLSRDHHHGLLLCWKIRQGLEKKISVERIAAYVTYFFQADLKPHFEQEENHVFSLLPDNDPMKIEALAQHDILNGMVKKLDSEALLKDIADELDHHIRFEERELFNYIEKNADAILLAQAGAVLEQEHKSVCDDWKDEFWK